MASKLDRLQKKGFKVNEAALSKIARGDQAVSYTHLTLPTILLV